VEDRHGILQRQRRRAPLGAAHPARLRGSGPDEQDICAEALDLLQDADLCAAADRHHRDHRTDANDQA
jgi:hypothetical protein